MRDGGRQGCRETTLTSVDLVFGLKTARRSTPVPHSPAWPWNASRGVPRPWRAILVKAW